MAKVREIYRKNSSTRAICDMLDRAGALTQTQISAAGDITAGCTCKCLRLLIDEGYVKRGPRALSRHRNSIGPRPWTYMRTAKALPTLQPPLPAVPGVQELCDIMNSIIRRSAAVS